MEVDFFVRGIIIGFSIAAPVGPIGILCVQRTLNQGTLYGFVSGLGAATADGCYGLIAAFSLTAALSILSGIRIWFSLIGGLYLVFLGIKAYRTVPAKKNNSSNSSGWISAYVSTYFLTLTNPMTILSFAAIFAGFGLGKTGGSYTNAGVLVTGVFIGSAIWWFILSTVASLIRQRFTPSHLRWVNRISGSIIIGFGLYVLAGLSH
jgi:threonine/homoserine/homoserine lactone efflux protein